MLVRANTFAKKLKQVRQRLNHALFIPYHIISQKQSSIKHLKQACSLFHRIIKFTKTSDITFLSQLNHWGKRGKESKKGKKE